MVTRQWLKALTLASALGSIAGCASSSSPPEEKEEKRVNQIQIQESLQRFVGVFLDRILQAAAPLMADTAPVNVKTRAMHQVLLYSSSSIDIATGRFPEVNLLDMLVFMDLTTGVLREYWVPEVFGEDGRPLLAAFARCVEDLDLVATGILDPAQVKRVHELVQEWRHKNPGQRRVEQLRPFVFAATVGRLSTGSEREASGILESVQAATQSADQAVLMAERAMFLSQRMPFLLRFHARLGLQELIKDGLATLSADETLKRAKELQPLVSDASTLVTSADQAAKDSRALLEALRPLLQPRGEGEELRAEKLVASANRLADETRTELRELGGVERALSSADRITDRAAFLLQEVRDDGRRGLFYLGVLVASLVSLYWVGYAAAHRFARDRDRDRPDREGPTRAPDLRARAGAPG
jgi:hypothetical protein